MPKAAPSQLQKPKPFQAPTRRPKPPPQPKEEPKKKVVVKAEDYWGRPTGLSMKEHISAVAAVKEYNKQVAESSKFYKQIGFAKYGGLYEPFEIPEGMKVTTIEETPVGLNVTFQEIQKKQAEKKPVTVLPSTPYPSALPSSPSEVMKSVLPPVSVGEGIQSFFAESIKGLKEYAYDPNADASRLDIQILQQVFETAERTEPFVEQEVAKFEAAPLTYVGIKALEVGGVVALVVAPEVAAPAYFIGAGLQTGIIGVTEKRLPTVSEFGSAGLQTAGFSGASSVLFKGLAAVPKVSKLATTSLGRAGVMTGVGGVSGYVFSGGDVEEAARSALLAGALTAGLEIIPKAARYTGRKVKGFVKEHLPKPKPKLKTTVGLTQADVDMLHHFRKVHKPSKIFFDSGLPTTRQYATFNLQDTINQYNLRTGKWAVKAQQYLMKSPVLSDGLPLLAQRKWAFRTVKHQLSLSSILGEGAEELSKSLGEYIKPIPKTTTKMPSRGGKVVQSGKQALIQLQKEVQKPIMKEVAKEVAKAKTAIAPLTLRQQATQKMIQRQKQKQKQKREQESTILMGVGQLSKQLQKAAQPQMQKQKSAQAAAQIPALAPAQAQVPALKQSPLSQTILAQPLLQLQQQITITEHIPKTQKRKGKRKTKKPKEEIWAKQMSRLIPLEELGLTSGLKASKGSVARHILGIKNKRRKGKKKR